MKNQPNSSVQNNLIKQEVVAMPKQLEKLKLFATIFPMEIKIILSFPYETLISEVKHYIQDSVRALNIGGFYIGKMTNIDDYLFLNNQKIGDLVSNNDSILVYSKEYRICEKTLGGKRNVNWYGDESHLKKKIKQGNTEDADDDKTVMTNLESNQDNNETSNNTLYIKESNAQKNSNTNSNKGNQNKEFKKPHVSLGNKQNNSHKGQNNQKVQGQGQGQGNNNKHPRINNNNHNSNNKNQNNSSKKGNDTKAVKTQNAQNYESIQEADDEVQDVGNNYVDSDDESNNRKIINNKINKKA